MMLYVSHLVADTLKPLIICSELGIIINANRKSYWAGYSGNPTIEERFFLWFRKNTCIYMYASTHARCNLFVIQNC